MTTLQDAQVTVVGLGLMGGSLAAALKAHHACHAVVGVARRAESTLAALVRVHVDLETTDLVALTSRTIHDPESLNRELEMIRKRGYAVTRGEVSPNLAGLAAPIYNRRGEVKAAISLGGEVSDLLGRRKNGVLRQLLEASREISAMMGYLPDTTAI